MPGVGDGVGIHPFQQTLEEGLHPFLLGAGLDGGIVLGLGLGLGRFAARRLLFGLRSGLLGRFGLRSLTAGSRLGHFQRLFQ